MKQITEEWMRAAPKPELLNVPFPTGEQIFMMHSAYSLWRIATALEAANELAAKEYALGVKTVNSGGGAKKAKT